MTIQEMHTAVNQGVDKINSNYADTLLANEIDLALNMAQESFVKTRLNPMGTRYGKGFEQSQKRIDDIRVLITKKAVDTFFLGSPYGTQGLLGQADLENLDPKNRFWIDAIQLPFDQEGDNGTGLGYEYIVNVIACTKSRQCRPLTPLVDWEVVIANGDDELNIPPRVWDAANSEWDENDVAIRTGLGEDWDVQYVKAKMSQLDDIHSMLDDPFNSTSHKAPIYTVSGQSYITQGSSAYSGASITDEWSDFPDLLLIWSDMTFYTSSVKLTYIRRPRKMDYTNEIHCELPLHTHNEIVNLTIDSLLEGFMDPRYKTHLAETAKSE